MSGGILEQIEKMEDIQKKELEENSKKNKNNQRPPLLPNPEYKNQNQRRRGGGGGRGRGRGRGGGGGGGRGGWNKNVYGEETRNNWRKDNSCYSQFQDYNEGRERYNFDRGNRHRNFYHANANVDDERKVASALYSQSSVVAPSQLVKCLSEFPEFEATLLTLLEKYDFNSKQLRRTVVDNMNIFHLEGELLSLQPKLSVCKPHLDVEGCRSKSSCKNLHLCPQYVLGKCKEKDYECLCGHDIQTNHNKKFILSPLNKREDLKVCEDYNNGKCEAEVCSALHLCRQYLDTNCSSEDGCNLCHKVSDEQVRSILALHGIDLNESPKDIVISIVSCPLIKESIQALGEGNNEDSSAKGKEDSSTDKLGTKESAETQSSKPVKPILKTTWADEFFGEVTHNEICFNSVENFCPYEESGCYRLHCNLHFHWQVKCSKRNVWFNLTNDHVLALEKSYCDPTIDKVLLPPLDPAILPFSSKGLLLILNGRSKWEANFDTMQLNLPGQNKDLELRRLCSEYNPNKEIAPCTFKWYFLDKNMKWIEYGNLDSTGEEPLKSEVCSNDIEKHLRQSPNTPLHFKSSSFSYVLDVQNMTQTNLKTKVVRKVKRRPSAHLLQEEETSKDKVYDIPSSWDAMKPDERVKIVSLSPSSDEYKDLSAFLQKQGSTLNILKIERIQNPYLWRAFQNKVQELSSLYKDKNIVNIQQLFHGTKPEVIPKICEENFDWRLHGTSAGQSYGRGTYFAPSPATSNSYTAADANGMRFMFVAKVAVGTITVGTSNMARPPNNPQYNVAFDSTGNAAVNPSIIVKYDKQEYFPEYILTYS